MVQTTQQMDFWNDKLKMFDEVVALSPNFERQGKSMPFTSANGYMFSQMNKDGQLGIRLGAEASEKFKKEHKTTDFRAYGAIMKDYVLVPEPIFRNKERLLLLLEESYSYVMSLPPRQEK